MGEVFSENAASRALEGVKKLSAFAFVGGIL
jgi:hypothetical protein